MTDAEKKAAATKRVRSVGKRRAAALAAVERLTGELRVAVVESDGVLNRMELARLGQCDRQSVYNWIRHAEAKRKQTGGK